MTFANAAELRAELERVAETEVKIIEITRLDKAWEILKPQTPDDGYHEIIESRLKALRPFIPTEGTDFELDYRGIVDGAEAWEWVSCGSTFGDNYCSDDTFTKEGAIADAVEFLAMVFNEPPDFSELEVPAVGVDISLPETCPYKSGVHFALCTFEGQEGVHWQGLCREPGESERWFDLPADADFSHLSSDRGYFNANLAAADCIFSIHRERGYNIEEATTIIYELGLPIHEVIEENNAEVTAYVQQLKAAEYAEHWSRLWASDQQAIESAIQVLPEADRDQTRYDMAFRIKPMPEQYWPENA